MPSVGLYTLGCKVSLYETEAVAEAFVKAGFSVLSFEDKCDVYVINTCTVTARRIYLRDFASLSAVTVQVLIT